MSRLVLFRRLHPGALLSCAVLVALVAGCARETTSPVTAPSASDRAVVAPGASLSGAPDQEIIRQDGSAPPSGLVTAHFGDASLQLWPFTGNSFDGAGVDPVNLIFVGRATPMQIRDALLSLDGNRAPLGFPDAPPWNQRWKDASGGDVQTNYAEPAGWTGSEIQLTAGDYGPLRFHLRLFRTASPYGDGGWWTVGAAHFELLVPGTVTHMPLSWGRAEEFVVADCMRSGLLDADTPMGLADGVGPTPSWRAIEPFIYNELPPELIAYIGGPQPPVSEPVPLTNDGAATVLHLAGAAPPAGPTHDMFTIQMHQAVPRPFCNEGPADIVMVDGPIYFETTVTVDPYGKLAVTGSATGSLSVTPLDVSQDPPVPAGPSWNATISDRLSGTIAGQVGRVQFQTKRILPQETGSEMVMTRLMVASSGQNSYTSRTRCLSEELTP